MPGADELCARRSSLAALLQEDAIAGGGMRGTEP